MAHVAVIGGGIIGSSWALVFARAGIRVRLHSRNKPVRDTLYDRLGAMAQRAELIAPDVDIGAMLERIELARDLADAVIGADYVQESLEEDVMVKRAVFAEIARHASKSAVLASSTSSLAASEFASEIEGRSRAIVVHPAAPPHLVPVVEIVPAPFTGLGTVETSFELMRGIGQVPVLVKKEQPGFVMNRLQGALLLEMFRIIQDDVMSAEDVDKLISEGFGLRWAFLGPLEGIDLNAPGGIADYLKRYGFMFDNLARERGMIKGKKSVAVTPELIGVLDETLRSELPLHALKDKTAWRDERMAALRALKREMGGFPER
jgi:L-gulonate 3-dehydrogenase